MDGAGEAIAACTIGGVSVNGGIGRISGVLIGVLVFEDLQRPAYGIWVLTPTTSTLHRVLLS